MRTKEEPRSMRRAKLLREGKSWRQACLLSGYSLSAANRGPKSYFAGSPGMRREFTRLVEEDPYSPDVTRKIAKNRLTKAVVEGRSSNVVREIELLGRFRDHDWWVRSAEVQVGVFSAIMEPHPDMNIDAYKEEDALDEPLGVPTERAT